MRRTALVIGALVWGVACGGGEARKSGADAMTADGSIDVPLVADPGAARYAVVGDEVVLDGSASTGAERYQWHFGNGTGWDEPRPDPVARVRYPEAGRYTAVLTAYGAGGARRAASVVVSVTEPLVHSPRQSSTVAAIPGRAAVAVVSPDSDELVMVSHAGDAFAVEARWSTAAGPRTVTPWRDWLVVACQDAGVVELIPLAPAAPRLAVVMPPASRPFGVVGDDAALYVSLQATGQLARISVDGDDAVLRGAVPATPDARGVALLPDGRIAVTRWRSPGQGAAARAHVAVVDPQSFDVSAAPASWALAFDPQPSSDTESGGVPSYLEQVLVSPTGALAAVPSLQANVGEGGFRAGVPLSFQSTVRAALSLVSLPDGVEQLARRKLFDDRGFAAAGVFSSRGDYLFLAMRGSRAVERIDILGGGAAGTILGVGHAPQGLALSADDRLLFVDAYLSRELVVYAVDDYEALPQAIARIPIVASEPLAPEILRGKQLFNDAFDTRLGKDSYLACAHCHLDGMSDGRVWDFSDRGEGLRNTHSLLGRAGDAHGPIHWTGNFDEIHDFEHDIRAAFGGTGLMRDEDFHAGTRDQTLGDPKAGISADLDALAAYVSSLATFLPSPYRRPDGALTAAAARGKALFESAVLGCTTCHAGPRLTDSAFIAPGQPLLHDVGTLGPGSGQRLGMSLDGLDTPTLHGLWSSPPYLHDGSAETLRDVLTARNPADAHGVTSGLSGAEIEDLVAYLLSLDGRAD